MVGHRALAVPVIAQGGQALQRLTVPLVQRQQRARHSGHACGQLADLCQRHGIARALPAHPGRQVGQHLAQARDEPRFIVV